MANNAAFIDSNNLYQAMKIVGWPLDYDKFKTFLSDKYGVQKRFFSLGTSRKIRRCTPTSNRKDIF